MSTTPQREIISRQAAHLQGRRRFYTGTPCNVGHVAERYVSNGACVECGTGRYKYRQNAYHPDLAPYATPTLWAPRTLTAEELQALTPYLQRCIIEYTRHVGKLTNDLDDAFRMQLERM